MLSVDELMQHISCGMVVCLAEPPFTITQINPLATAWAGVTEDAAALIGKPLIAFAPQAMAEWEEAIVQAAEQRESLRIDMHAAQWPDGKLRAMTALCVPIPLSVPQSVLTMLIDSPALSLIPAAPAESIRGGELRQMEDALAHIPIPLWLFDTRGRVRFVNAATLALFKVKSFDEFVELVGLTLPDQIARLRPRMTSEMTIADVTERSLSMRNLSRATSDGTEIEWASDLRRGHAEQLTRGELAISRALSRRTVTNQLISLVHPTLETEIIVRASAAPIVNRAGRLIGAYYVTDDVTDEMLLHGQRDAMLAIAGHDLRNPLTPARILLQQMLRKLKRTPGFEHEVGELNRVLDQLTRIQQIADDLDAVAATARGDVVSVNPSVDLYALAQTVATEQMARQPYVRVTVHSNMTEIKGGWGRRHMEQVLAMLVSSSARRTPPGKAVTIRLKQLRSQVRVEIADQGEMLTPQHLSELHDVLSRGGAALAYGESNDLDLSVVQTLLKLYHSQLLVSSKPRLGTNFWFMLPLPISLHKKNVTMLKGTSQEEL